ncbi:MAG: hypothetical protein ACYC6A_14325 [Armatimonadota bacterium]
MTDRRAGKRKIWLILIVIALIAGVAINRWYYFTTHRIVVSPAPALPKPNALDIYLAASSAIVFTMSGASGATFDVADAIRAVDAGIYTGKAYGSKKAPTPAQIRALAAKNQQAIAMLRRGFTCDARQRPIRSLKEMNTSFDGIRYRKLMRVLMLDATVKSLNRDWAGATERYVDTIQMSADTTRGGSVMPALVGYTMEAVAKGELWEIMPQIPPEAARTGARRLEEIAARRELPVAIFTEEKWQMEAVLQDLFRRPNWRKDIVTLATMHLDEDNMVGQKIAEGRLYLLTPGRVLHNYDRYMNVLIQRVGQPYNGGSAMPELPKDQISGFFTSTYDKVYFKFTQHQTHMQLLMTTFALKAYHADHQSYPKQLKELTPAYLKALPVDPFDGKPLRYIKRGKTYTLYSVGPDGKDDGSTPSVDGQKKSTSSIPGSLLSKSKGDVVAGINVQ